MNSLQTDGFVVLRNVIEPPAIKMAQQNINSKVNYSQIKAFIDQNMMKGINKSLPLDLVNIKYRVSNNNNSSDAGSFHRDLHSYHPNEVTPVFTCLTYLDTAYMQLIPETYRHIKASWGQMNKLWKKRRTVKMNPGDILVFYASTMHRGVFYHKRTKNGNRRLIQLFDCVPKNKLDFFMESILHIPCLNNCNQKMAKTLIRLNKNKVMNKIINSISSIMVFQGYGARYNGLKHITSDPKIRYLSTESNQKRLQNVYNNKFLESNCYIVNTPDNLTKDTTPKERDAFEFYSFYLHFIEMLVKLLIIVIVCVIVVRYYKLGKKNNVTVKKRVRKKNNKIKNNIKK